MNAKEAQDAAEELVKRATGKIGYRLDGPNADVLYQECMVCHAHESHQMEMTHDGDERLYRALLAFFEVHEHRPA